MASSEEIHALLDRHLNVLTELGSPAARRLGDPIPPLTVDERLNSYGYAARDDVVGFFSWRRYPQLTTPRDALPALFWEQPYALSLDEAIEVYSAEVEVMDVEFPEWHTLVPPWFPGPAHFLPFVTYFDAVGWSSVDCREDPDGGAVYRCDQLGQVRLLISSLAEAIGTATYCLQVGLWTVAADGSIEKT